MQRQSSTRILKRHVVANCRNRRRTPRSYWTRKTMPTRIMSIALNCCSPRKRHSKYSVSRQATRTISAFRSKKTNAFCECSTLKCWTVNGRRIRTGTATRTLWARPIWISTRRKCRQRYQFCRRVTQRPLNEFVRRYSMAPTMASYARISLNFNLQFKTNWFHSQALANRRRCRCVAAFCRTIWRIWKHRSL